MNNKTELVQKVLTDLGFRPQVDDEGDVFFNFEMKTMYIICRYEENFLNVVYPQFYELDEDEEYVGLFLCMKETRDIKHIKTFLDGDLKNVSSSAEFWFVGEEDLKNSLENAIQALGCVRSRFLEDMKEIQNVNDDETEDDSSDSEDAEDADGSNETPGDTSDAKAGTEEVA